MKYALCVAVMTATMSLAACTGGPRDGARIPALGQLTYNVLTAAGARARTPQAAPEIVA